LILSYGLATTIASVFVFPANISNTFGRDGFRALGGAVIMSCIVLFYFINLHIRDLKLLWRFIDTVGLSFLFASFIIIIHSAFYDSAFLYNFIPVMILGVVFAFSKLLKGGMERR